MPSVMSSKKFFDRAVQTNHEAITWTTGTELASLCGHCCDDNRGHNLVVFTVAVPIALFCRVRDRADPGTTSIASGNE